MMSVATESVSPGNSIWSLDSVGLSPGRIAAKAGLSGIKCYWLALSNFSLLFKVT